MRDLKDLLTRVKQEHLDRLGSIRREPKMLPPGRLEALQQHGRIYYYQNAQARRRGITPETGTGATTGQKAVLVGGTEDFAA